MFRRDGLPARLLAVVLIIAVAWASSPIAGFGADLPDAGAQEAASATVAAAGDASDKEGQSSATDASPAADAEGSSSDAADAGSTDAKSDAGGSDAGTAATESDDVSDDASKAVPACAPSAGTDDADSSKSTSAFTAHWTNKPDSEISYVNKGYDAENSDTWTDLVCDCSGGGTHVSTIGIHMNLAGDESTSYETGSVKIYIPAGYYQGYDETNPLRTLRDGSQIQWNIPKAPNTTDATDFNYTVETRNVDGKDVTYYVMQNVRALAGATDLAFEVSYRYIPYALYLTGTETQADGSNRGIYANSLPVSCEVNGSEIGTCPLSVLVKTHVETSTTELTHATKDPNSGVFISWDDAWGEKPADADQYFYVVWYAYYRKTGGSSQPYTYTMTVDDEQADGGTLVGVRKCVGQYDNPWHDAYDWHGYVYNRIDQTYAGIASNADYFGKTWIGIYDKMFDDHGYYNISNDYGEQAYYFLMKYPRSKISDAFDAWEKEGGKDYADEKMAKEGVPVTCGLKVEETWKDGHSESYTVSPNADGGDAAVKTLPSINTGKRTITKECTSKNWGGYQDAGVQSLIAAGNDVTLPDYTRYVYNVDDKPVWDEASGTCTATTGFEATDGTYYLYSSTPGSQGIMSVYGVKPGVENISGRSPVKMSDDDYSYTSFYLDDSEFDASYLEHIGWQKANATSQDFSSYAPVEVWCRTKGQASFEKYGEIRRSASSSYVFTSSDGTVTEGVSANKRVAFPEDTVQVKIVQKDSGHFATSLTFHFGIRIHATDSVREKLHDDISKGQNSLFGGFASGELTVEGTSLGRSGETAGTYWNNVSLALSPLQPSNVRNMTYSMMGDDTNKSEKSVQVIEAFGNGCDSPHEYQQAKYMHDFMVTSGIIYDLLPAGTYVKPEDVRVDIGNMNDWYGGKVLQERQVELIDNWNGTGRTMMKVTVHIPDTEAYQNWIDDTNGFHAKSYGIRIVYRLYDPYLNIVDRGGLVRGTAMFVNTSDDNVVFNSNAKDASFTGKGFDDWDAFKSVAEEAWSKGQECSVVTAQTDFGTVPYRQSGFENTVTTDNGRHYGGSAQVYPGDSYAFRLRYTSKGNTRSDSLVMFDTVDGNGTVGSLESVDVSTIAEKVTYDANNPDTTDTCAPVVWYATVVPTEDQKDLSNEIWKKWTDDTDPSQVKAIAIDCRKTKSGADFVLDGYGTLVAHIHMKATTDASVASKTTDAYAGEIRSRMFSGSSAGEGTADTMKTSCTAELLRADLSIEKSSDPASGTKERPAEIGNSPDTAITYTIKVTNKDDDTADKAVHDIVVEDTLPEGFELDASKPIEVNGKSIYSQSAVSHSSDGRTLHFTISSLSSKGTVSIAIPAIRKDPVGETTTYENTATIDTVGNIEDGQSSNTTYHRTSVVALPLAGGDGFGGLVAAGLALAAASAYAHVRRRRRA